MTTKRKERNKDKMDKQQSHHHRPGALKQQNKKHKALGKASLRRASISKGKVPEASDTALTDAKGAQKKRYVKNV